MPDDQTCKCPGCNCYSGLVHVPTSGTYMVFPGGRVKEVREARFIDTTPTGHTIYTVALEPDE